jgi:hypothetical protein
VTCQLLAKLPAVKDLQVTFRSSRWRSQWQWQHRLHACQPHLISPALLPYCFACFLGVFVWGGAHQPGGHKVGVMTAAAATAHGVLHKNPHMEY